MCWTAPGDQPCIICKTIAILCKHEEVYRKSKVTGTEECVSCGAKTMRVYTK